jgi:hypothetical protein
VDIGSQIEALERAGAIFRILDEREITVDSADSDALSPPVVRAVEELAPFAGDVMVFLRARDFEMPLEDSYSVRFLAAVRRVAGHLPPALLPWLRENRPELYSALTIRIPDRLQALWASRAPMREFDAELAELESYVLLAAEFFARRSRDAA